MRVKNLGIRKALIGQVEADLAYKKAIYRAVRYCTHRAIGECKSLSMTNSSLPPHRVCMNCGLREVGWGIGHFVLATNFTIRLSREELYSIATVTINEDDKGLILRNESDLYRIVRAKLDLPEFKHSKTFKLSTSAKRQQSAAS